MRPFYFLLFFCSVGFALETIYVVNSADSKVYSVDPITGASMVVTPVLIGEPPGIGNAAANGIKLATPTIGYTLGFTDERVYRVHLDDGTFEPVATLPGGFSPSNLALASPELAYVIGQNSQSVVSVNLTTGAFDAIVTFAGLPFPSDISLQGNTAYVVGYDSQAIFVVDLTNNTYISKPVLGEADLSGISVLGNTAYIAEQGGDILSYDLINNTFTTFTTIPGGAGPYDLSSAENDTILYTGGSNNPLVYKIDVGSGMVTQVTPLPVGSVGFNDSLFGVVTFKPFPPPPPTPPFVPTAGLSGNILRFADYLNENAPQSTIDLFNSLSGSQLIDALKAAMPARLGFATFASQNGYLASTQVVTDHLYQKRFFGKFDDNNRRVGMNLSERALLASRNIKKSDCCCERQSFSTLWLGAFGEYAHENGQNQTPAFNLSLGGAILGLDYNGVDGDVVGVSASYAYTHLKEAKHMGDANVNQGFVGVYSLLRASKWYFELGLWGGYYHSANHRKISFFPTYNATAKSKTHGWQAAPHFEVGYDGYFSTYCSEDKFGVSPFLLADWVANWESGFSEHGAPDLNFHQKAKFCSLFRGEAGLRFYEILNCGKGQLILQEKGSYAYQKMFHTGTVTAFLVGSPGSFTVGTLISAQNLGVIEFSALFKPWNPNAPYITFRYQGEFGSMYQSHQGIVEIGKDF